MFKTTAAALVLGSVAMFALAEDTKKAETPAEGVSAILGYLEKDDLQGLFLNRYGELERFAKTDEEKQKIAGEMAQKLAGKKALLLEGFRKAKGIEPEVMDRNGEKVAVFKLEKGQMMLYLKNGVWKFHL
jgi:hypothetical protein